MLRAWRVVVLSDSWVDRIGAIVPAENCVAMENPVVEWPLIKRVHEGEIRFLFLGRLERDKGAYELIEAFARVCEQAQCRLVLGGDGELKSAQALANELGIETRIDFLGWVTGDVKRRAFSDADIFVLPSHIEGLPVSMLEAMHCGLPIVICPVGSIPEVLCDGKNALFVPPGEVERLAEAMIRLAVDPELRKRLGKAGRRVFAHRFSTDAVLPRLENLYQAAKANSGSKTRSQGRNGYNS
jgi:glycosyltransferase involved in cell wall biosynthesis